MQRHQQLLGLIRDMWSKANETGHGQQAHIDLPNGQWFKLQVAPGGEKPRVGYIDSDGLDLGAYLKRIKKEAN